MGEKGLTAAVGEFGHITVFHIHGEQTGVVLPTTDGGQLDFNDLEGKPALLWFWAPW